jgi:hypothetical protein
MKMILLVRNTPKLLESSAEVVYPIKGKPGGLERENQAKKKVEYINY